MLTGLLGSLSKPMVLFHHSHSRITLYRIQLGKLILGTLLLATGRASELRGAQSDRLIFSDLTNSDCFLTTISI